MQSPDGGGTWQTLGGPTYSIDSILHNDQHCVAVNPNDPNDLLVGCDGGAFRLAYNPAANTWAFTSLNVPLGITQFYTLACAPNDPTRLLGGASPLTSEGRDAWARDIRAIRHLLAEQDVPTYLVDPIRPLATQLVRSDRPDTERAA